MTPRTLSAGLLLGLLLPASACAQDLFPGQYGLKGRYSTRRSTQVDLSIRKLPHGGIVVSRTGKFTSRRFKNVPAFTWTSSSVKVTGRRLEVTYIVQPDGAGDGDGLIGGLDPDHASTRQVLTALSQENRFKAVYFLSRDKKSLREVVLNQTRLGDQSWWRFVSAKGLRKEADTPQALTQAEFLKKAHKAMTDWYLADTEETYEYLLGEATTDAEKQKLLADKKLDMDPDSIEFVDDEYFMDDIKYRYDDGNPYLDAFGKPIPLENVVVIAVSMFPEHAGIGLSKTFVFDNRTATIIDEGDIQD